jgi:hypothetical protein
MTRWEYRIVEVKKINELIKQINELGQQGWEAVGMSVGTYAALSNDHYVLLKRIKE